MKRLFYAVVAITLITVIGLTILMGNDEKIAPPTQTVSVGVEEGKVNVISINNEKTTLTFPEQIVENADRSIALMTATPMPSPTPTIAVADLNPTPKPPICEIHITDANGDPIPSGTVSIDGGQYEFNNGVLNIKDIQPGQYSATAAADGYQDTTETITLNENKAASIVMEYLCSFEIVLHQGPMEKTPVEGAEIVLWKGPKLTRPVQNRISIPIKEMGKGTSIATVVKQGMNVAIKTLKPISGLPDYTPAQGDRIAGIDNNMLDSFDAWETTPNYTYVPLMDRNSRLLRVWDALTAFASNPTGDMISTELNLKRGDKNVYAYLPEIDKSQYREIIARGTTNSEGVCRFDNLPAGLYFAQAAKDRKRSYIVLLHPAGGGHKIHLAEGSLHVKIVRENARIEQTSEFANTELQLKAKTGGVYMQTAKQGTAMFQDVPWGDYTLTASPPNETPVSVPVSITEPYQTHTVTFSGEGGLEFSGKVVRGDTNQPVEGIPLQLTFFESLDRTIRANQTHGVELSKADGSFRFENVRPGRYTIQVLTGPHYKGFLPKLAFFIPDNPYMKDFAANVVIDKNIADYTFEVYPGVETHIWGTVVKSDGTPATGASLKLVHLQSNAKYDLEIPLAQTKVQSDENGNFDISFITYANDNTYKTRLDAVQIKEVENKTYSEFNSTTGKNGRIGTWSSMGQQGFVQAQGSHAMEFKLGDTISGLRVVLEDVDPFIVEGKVTTEDGQRPELLSVYVNSRSASIQAAIDEERNYHAELPAPGKYILRIEATQIDKRIKGFEEKKHYKEYCDESFTIELNEENRTVRKDVILEKAYYLFGQVIDKDRNPIPNLYVTAKAMSDGKQVSFENDLSTDEQGYFTITGLRQNYEYTLVVTKSMKDSTPLARMDGLIPVEFESDQVVLIVVDNGS